MVYKKILKNIINYSIGFNIESIKEKIQHFEFVSFDIFDTLIKRDLADISDVFTIVEKKYNELYAPDSLNDFKQLRIDSEKKAINNKKNLEEITVDQIYDSMSCFDGNKREKIKKLELAAEIEVCTKHKAMYDIYQWCVQSGKKVIIISDMYLDTNTVKAILSKNGYKNYFKLYLSSNIGMKKSSGNLFKYVIKDLKIKSKQLVHIGDNFKSDYLQARRRSIHSILIPTKIDNMKYGFKKNNLEGILKYKDNKIKAIINNRVDRSWDDYYSFGYEVFGPILLGFTDWLHKDLNLQGFSKVFFLSRDGYIMKKAFDQMYPDSYIQSKYLYVSRRSTRVPLIYKNPTFESVVDLVIGKNYFNLKYFFANIGLKIGEYKTHLLKLNIDSNKVLSKREFLTNEKYKKLFENIKKDMILNSKKENSSLTGYLNQENFEGHVAIVDIGWRGTMQTSLSNIYPSMNIIGYYMGLSSSTYNKKNMYGYLFSPVKENDKKSEIYNSFVGLFEILFLSFEGSTQRYHYNGSKYEPVLTEYEFSEGSIERQRLNSIQIGALKFVEDFKGLKLDNSLITNTVVYNNLLNLGRKPSNKFAKLLGNFIYVDSNKGYLAKPKPFLVYLLNFKKLKQDLSESAWKIGFLKRLLKIKLPYDKIYDFLKRTI